MKEEDNDGAGNDDDDYETEGDEMEGLSAGLSSKQPLLANSRVSFSKNTYEEDDEDENNTNDQTITTSDTGKLKLTHAATIKM